MYTVKSEQWPVLQVVIFIKYILSKILKSHWSKFLVKSLKMQIKCICGNTPVDGII